MAIVAIGIMVSTHSRLKAAGEDYQGAIFVVDVSTHSRLKAAGAKYAITRWSLDGFNTQPPEGGWYQQKRKRAG